MPAIEKYYISCDLEGITGISNFREMNEQKAYASKMMTDDVKVIASSINQVCLKSGLKFDEIEIIIADSHSLGTNINLPDLPSNVKLIRGFPRPYYMSPTLSDDINAIFFAGYHSKIGSLEGGMDHTFSNSVIYRVLINDSEVGEFEINAALAGHYNIPVAFASGDDNFINQIEYLKNKLSFETVVTKESISRCAAKLYHPEKVHAEMAQKVQKTLIEKNWAKKIFKYEYPLKARIELTNTLKADLAALIPSLKRTDGRSVEFTAPDFPYFYNMLCAITMIGWADK
ncbi:MAG: M55 family metallopeptidase [Candidatus Wallbacteria bacterium]